MHSLQPWAKLTLLLLRVRAEECELLLVLDTTTRPRSALVRALDAQLARPSSSCSLVLLATAGAGSLGSTEAAAVLLRGADGEHGRKLAAHGVGPGLHSRVRSELRVPGNLREPGRGSSKGLIEGEGLNLLFQRTCCALVRQRTPERQARFAGS